MNHFTRRSFVSGAVAAAVAGAAGSVGAEARGEAAPIHAEGVSSFCEILRTPDRVTAYGEDKKSIDLVRSQSTWHASGIEVRTDPKPDELAIHVSAPSLPLTRIHLRWKMAVDPSILAMGDAWERSYGELAWRSFVPERVMPWYFATAARDGVHGYGVRTGASSFCFWQIDREGVSLWLDTSNGGLGVALGQRELHAATVVSRRGRRSEPPLDAVTGLCRKMCPSPRNPKGPVHGANDWYYAYGKNTAAQILRDTDLVAALSPSSGHRPFSVIDGGWEGGWEGNDAPPDMARLAEEIRSRNVRPGVWVRVLEAPKTEKPSMLLPAARSSAQVRAYDPTIPEALDMALERIKRPVAWKYDLIKHDFSTFDLFVRWGFEMGAQPSNPGWHFSDRSKTNAEIVVDFYSAIRRTAGESCIILGCNTIGHLSAGLFELQRTGDDTSGQQWERTRRMGVNTLAYRLPQNRTFFVVDPDCVGITQAVPWAHTRDWLDAVARSGAALFISPEPRAIGEEQRAAIREAFAIAASGAAKGQPLDWLRETAPQDWQFEGPSAQSTRPRHYNWCGDEGCDPFPA